VLGRTAKTEVLNWNGTVYSTTANTFDARDQITLVRQYQGSDQSGVYQDTTMSYDGHGRFQSRHAPEESAGSATVYAYNADDTVYSVTDARGATCTYGYNNRGQVTSATHTLAGQPTIALSYGYDAAGNRTSMTDDLGSTTYSYDQLSRLTSETRYFNALWNSPTGGNYGISYQYNLANELTSITDPFGAQIGYTRDTNGRTTAATGSGFGNVSAYVSNIQYRAWGGVKAASYGNSSVSTTVFNNRLQPAQFRLTDANSGASYIRENYAYYGDEHVQSVADLDDTAGNNPPATLRFLSRSYGYDQAGRVTQAYSSNQAPLNQTYGYDEFDNMTSRSGTYYWQPYQSETFTYTGNRHNGWSYYADGQVSYSPATTTDDAHSFYYDAAGRLSRTIDTATNRTVDYRPSYDGDDKLASEWSQTTQNGYPNSATSSYIVRSTALNGEILTRLNQNGNKSNTYVPAEGLLFAVQGTDYYGSPYVGWIQRNPLGITETGKGIYDPLGNYIPFQQHADPRPPAGSYNSSSMSGLSASVSNANDYGMGCFVDAVPTNCNRAMAQVNNGSAYVGSIVSRMGNGIVVPLGLTFEQHYVREGRELVLATSLRFFRDLVPGNQPGFEPNPQRTGLVNQDAWERKHITADACGHMADLAQQQANKALSQAHGDASKALGAFDLGFSRIYAGKPMDGISNAIDLFNNGPTGRTIGSYYLGETGFKVQYMDTGADMIKGHSNADQTHHFAAMFSSGINTTGVSWLGSAAHNFNDNAGDQRLTNAAYDLGSRLQSNPNLLRKVGSLIRSEICDRKTRGKHL
jgi:YD repeat-containing protein